MDEVDLRHRIQTLAEGSREDDAVYELYHLNSNLVRSDTASVQRITYFNQSDLGRELIRRAAKPYACATRVELPAPHVHLPRTLTEAIRQRRSVRRFTGAPLDLTQLSTLLKYANGLLDSVREDGLRRTAIPSGGALYPTELYVLPLEVSGLPPGAYHYDRFEHFLARFIDEPAEPVLAAVSYTDAALVTASVAIVISGYFERQQIKYGERAYRFTLLECGHLAQNILLMACALGLAALPVGGFLDDELNEYLRLDGRREAALYVILLGTAAASVGGRGD
jgi:SagB-type dehydrogenase family enzyme